MVVNNSCTGESYCCGKFKVPSLIFLGEEHRVNFIICCRVVDSIEGELRCEQS